MHSYLVIGNNKDKLDEEVDRLTKKLGGVCLEYRLAKIADVRELNSFTKLKVEKPTAILIRDIDEASAEALNAFLKNLEEPQEQINYILTATSIYSLLPTIISRCQVINVPNRPEVEKEEVEEIKNYFQMSPPEKISYICNIRKREEAISFIRKVILVAHFLLLKGNYLPMTKILKSANKSLVYLKANGNVGLQLTNFVLGIS